ncbi:hypothetical protein CYMTET_27930 [Cymbomonas tetramitiformis]|uniref:histidine kinase n=1 Tax=Cymbomonas tetramitiformis TaxID=36881 RepID=A0AAE0KWP0_9CHLO|nr:hypothetical protein CYMTET_27930 [Cymbomonas tetramitiformis]
MFDHIPEALLILDSQSGVVIHGNSKFDAHVGALKIIQGKVFADTCLKAMNKGAFEEKVAELKGKVHDPNASDEDSFLGNLQILQVKQDNSLPFYGRFDLAFSIDSDNSRCFVTFRRVSPLSAAEREAEAEYADFFDNAPIALHWLSGSGHILWANKTEMITLGYTAEEYIGQPIMKFCPDDEELVLEIFKSLGSGNTIRDVPVRFRRKDQTLVYLLIDSNVAYNQDGSFKHTRCFIRDDSRRRIEEASQTFKNESMKQIAASKDKFLHKLVHQFKTPLHILTESIQQGLNCVTLDACGTLSSLVEDIVDVLAFEEGKVLQMRKEWADLRSLLTGAIPVTAREGGENKIIIEIDDQIASIETDPVHLGRVLKALVKNATIFSSNGEVTICVKEVSKSSAGSTQEVYFEVTNPGAPVDSLVMNNMFQRYYQAQPPVRNQKALEPPAKHLESEEQPQTDKLSSDVEGLGVSLNLAYNVVQNMESTLNVESKDGITTFNFTLKARIQTKAAQAFAKGSTTYVEYKECSAKVWMDAKDSDVAAKFVETSTRAPLEEEHIPPKVGLEEARPRRVLVVEDNTICQRLLKALLEKAKVTKLIVDIASNGKEAVDMLAKLGPVFDVILMDLRMPVMDGLEATLYIKETLQLDTPIMALTAEHTEESREVCMAHGMVCYLSKPCNRKDLQKALWEHCLIDVKFG